MIGLYFEGSTPCSGCGNNIPLNALVEDFVCSECLTENTVSIQSWKHILESMFKEGPRFHENETQKSSIFADRTYSIVYGRQNPKYRDNKGYIDMAKAISGAEQVINPATGQAFSIRPMPKNMKDINPYVTHLVAEDSNLFSVHGKNQPFYKDRAEIHTFSCPSCGAGLQTDGSARTLKCNYCTHESYIPDMVWQKMHPKQVKQSFYFWFDESKVPFTWENALLDCVIDEKGVVYLCLEMIFDSSKDDELWIVALHPDLTIKWKNDTLKFPITTNVFFGTTLLGINAEGEIMVWSRQRSAMRLLSAENGRELRRIGAKSESGDTSEGQILDFKKCLYITALPSGGYFAFIERSTKNSEPTYHFVRLDNEARILHPWNNSPKGFWGFLKNLFSDIPNIENIRSHPTQCQTRYISSMSIGLDGSFYIQEGTHIIKLDAQGHFVYHTIVEEEILGHKIFGDAEGKVYYLSKKDKRQNLVEIDAVGKLTVQHIASVLDNGHLAEEDMLAISANGTIFCGGYSGRIRMFDAQRNLIYVSSSSLKNEEYLKKEQAKQEEEDE